MCRKQVIRAKSLICVKQLDKAEEEKEFLRDYIYPALQKNGLSHVEVFIWDHNKERVYERVRDTLDDTTKEMVGGIAFHWYSGDHFEGWNWFGNNTRI